MMIAFAREQPIELRPHQLEHSRLLRVSTAISITCRKIQLEHKYLLEPMVV